MIGTAHWAEVMRCVDDGQACENELMMWPTGSAHMEANQMEADG